MKLYYNLLFAGFLLLAIMNEGCKSNKVPTETAPAKVEVIEEVVNPLGGLLQELHLLNQLELNGRTITLDSVLIPVYNDKGQLLSKTEIITFFRDKSKKYDIYGNDQLEPKVVIFRDKTAADDKVVAVRPTPPPSPDAPMETKLEYAPDFKIKDMSGIEVSLDALKGKVVVLNFWFTQCQPCIHEMPDLNALVKKYKDNEEVVFLAITHNSKETVTAFLEKTAFDYTILPDAQSIMDDYIVMGFPTNLVLDKKGDIQYQSMGYRSRIDGILNDEIKYALKK